MASGSTFSVIGADVTITGNVSASADLHIDGTVEGDITCSSLVQGETSVVTGAIKAETARLAGTVNGSITARELVILKTARIEGDVHYDALTIEQGAQVDGRFAPNARQPVKAVPSAPIAAGPARMPAYPKVVMAGTAICSGITLPGMHWLRAMSSLAASSTHMASCFSVITQPGATALTRIPSGPNSRESDRVKPSMADLAVA